MSGIFDSGIFDTGIFDSGIFDTPVTAPPSGGGGGGGGSTTPVGDYPSAYPCPQISGYGLTVDRGFRRVTFDNGQSRQRRMYDEGPTVASLAFVLSVSDLYDWQTWVNEFGYDWFTMNLVSKWSATGEPSLHRIRVISDLAIEALAQQFVKVSLTAEFDLTYTPT